MAHTYKSKTTLKIDVEGVSTITNALKIQIQNKNTSTIEINYEGA